jgi:hypothetical protein
VTGQARLTRLKLFGLAAQAERFTTSARTGGEGSILAIAFGGGAFQVSRGCFV